MSTARPARRKKRAAPKVRAKPAKPKRTKRATRPRSATKRSGVQRPLTIASPYPWAVAEALVRHVTDVQLRDLMRNLLIEEAHRARADAAKVLVNAEVKAPDDGADAYTPPGVTSHTWL